jgi:DNA-binding response OmpR family regulator
VPKSILTISRNERLQTLRTLVLEHAGYLAFAALNDNAALALIKAQNSSSLALLCHSVPEESKMLLATTMKPGKRR